MICLHLILISSRDFGAQPRGFVVVPHEAAVDAEREGHLGRLHQPHTTKAHETDNVKEITSNIVSSTRQSDDCTLQRHEAEPVKGLADRVTLSTHQ